MATRIPRGQRTTPHTSVNFFFKLRNWRKKELKDLSRNPLLKVSTSRKNSLELIELSSMNKVSLVYVSSCSNTGSIKDDHYWTSIGRTV
jgi:DMSO/TMAO reductase YedYZ molybdopterin-dependent catalytic subunit